MNRWFKLLLLLVAYLPFQVALNLAPGVDLLSGRLLIPGLFGVFIGARFFRGRLSAADFFRNRVALVLAALSFLAALSLTIAANPAWGARKLLVFASIFPLFWLVTVLVKSEAAAKQLAYVMVAGAGVSALVALGQFLSQFVIGQEALTSFWAAKVVPLFSGASFGVLVASNPSWQVNLADQTVMRAVGLFPDPHMLSFYLGLIFPFSLALFLFERRRRFLWLVVSGLLLIILLLTFSRGGYLGLAAALLVLVALGWPRFSQAAKKLLAASGLLAAALLVLFGAPVLGRLTSSFDLAEGSNLGRLAVWQESWAVIKDSPLVGVGLGNYPATVDFSGPYRSAVTSHNLYLDLWAEIGVLGLAVWFLVIFGAAQCAWRQLKKNPAMALGCLGALAYFSVHAFFETPIFNPTVLAFLMVILGLASTKKSKEDVL